MPLTSEEMETIIVDEMQGKEPRVVGDEADEFRESIKEDIELARANGWEIEIPAEWNVDVEGELVANV